MKKYLLMIASVGAVFEYSLAWAQQTDLPYSIYGRHMMWGDGWYGWFFGPLMMILFLAIAVAIVVLIVRWLGGSSSQGSPAPTAAPTRKDAIDILKSRFARGEIEKEEFEEKRRILEE
jgi:putative membrane protein